MEKHTPDVSADLHEAIRRRAEEIYFRNGCLPGHDAENWQRAETEILRESATPTAHRIVIKVQGVVYTGEYDVASADGYTPGEFQQGQPVAVRFQDDHLFLQRPNGRELETRIVNRSNQ